MTPSLQVLAVASEIFPLVKTGGLADVAGALPAALAAEGVLVRTIIPGFPAVMDRIAIGETVKEYPVLHGGPARIIQTSASGLELFVLDAPHLFARPGGPYVGPNGRDWADNAQRFAALSFAAADLAGGAVRGYRPDVLHAHDWQAGLAPAFLHYRGGERPATVMTVHNLAFQGVFPAELLGALGLPARAFAMDGVEYFGRIGYLKAGLALADHITTVSPTYAREIRTSEHGMGLDGLLRMRAPQVSGILNGIDVQVWDPSADEVLPARFDAKRITKRAVNKHELQARLGLAQDPDALLFGVVSRLTWQKGLDLLVSAIPTLAAQGVQLAVLGSGEAPLEASFTAAAAADRSRVAVQLGYDEALAHLIQAGSDAILIPSRFEPCGLTQLCAMRYGALPVVARVGGLADTVVDANEMALTSKAGTGIVFSPATRDALELAIERTVALWRDRAAWRLVQKRGMATDVSWTRPAARYAALYRGLVASRAP
ncbi:MAG: glycogen synthase GlgA [Gemmatimonadaceae bacterium]